MALTTYLSPLARPLSFRGCETTGNKLTCSLGYYVDIVFLVYFSLASARDFTRGIYPNKKTISSGQGYAVNDINTNTFIYQAVYKDIN